MKQVNRVQTVWILTYFLLLLPRPAVANQDLTLDEAVATLLQFNPQVDIATEQCVPGQGIFTLARSRYLPRVTVGGDVSRQHIKDLQPVDEDTVGRGSVSLSQLIYDFGRTTGAIDSSGFSLRELQLAITREVTASYLRAEENRKAVDLADETLGLAIENLEVAEGRYKAGLNDVLEFNDAQLNLTSA